MKKPYRLLWNCDFGTSYSPPEAGSRSLFVALLRYKKGQDRQRVLQWPDKGNPVHGADYNGEGSRTQFPVWSSHAHLPLIDLDGPHKYVHSKSGGHGHLYLNEAISTPRWVLLMVALRLARVIEPGYFWWSLRRGQNTVRVQRGGGFQYDRSLEDPF